MAHVMHECEANFVLDPFSSEVDESATLILVWNCPNNDVSPPTSLLDYICMNMFQNRIVSGCSTPSGLTMNVNRRDITFQPVK